MVMLTPPSSPHRLRPTLSLKMDNFQLKFTINLISVEHQAYPGLFFVVNLDFLTLEKTGNLHLTGTSLQWSFDELQLLFVCFQIPEHWIQLKKIIL